jgi:hypothetical protein
MTQVEFRAQDGSEALHSFPDLARSTSIPTPTPTPTPAPRASSARRIRDEPRD